MERRRAFLGPVWSCPAALRRWSHGPAAWWWATPGSPTSPRRSARPPSSCPARSPRACGARRPTHGTGSCGTPGMTTPRAPATPTATGRTYGCCGSPSKRSSTRSAGCRYRSGSGRKRSGGRTRRRTRAGETTWAPRAPVSSMRRPSAAQAAEASHGAERQGAHPVGACPERTGSPLTSDEFPERRSPFRRLPLGTRLIRQEATGGAPHGTRHQHGHPGVRPGPHDR
jgi:hypothetical protein